MKKIIVIGLVATFLQACSGMSDSASSKEILQPAKFEQLKRSDFSHKIIESQNLLFNAVNSKPIKSSEGTLFVRNEDGTITTLPNNTPINIDGTVTILNSLAPNDGTVGRRYIVASDGTIIWLDKKVPNGLDENGRIYIIGEDGTVIFLN